MEGTGGAQMEQNVALFDNYRSKVMGKWGSVSQFSLCFEVFCNNFL